MQTGEENWESYQITDFMLSQSVTNKHLYGPPRWEAILCRGIRDIKCQHLISTIEAQVALKQRRNFRFYPNK